MPDITPVPLWRNSAPLILPLSTLNDELPEIVIGWVRPCATVGSTPLLGTSCTQWAPIAVTQPSGHVVLPLMHASVAALHVHDVSMSRMTGASIDPPHVPARH